MPAASGVDILPIVASAAIAVIAASLIMLVNPKAANAGRGIRSLQMSGL
jgi:hypothetical protein